MTTQKKHLREKMAQYHGRSNTPGLAHAAFDFAGYVCCFLLLATGPIWLTIPVAFVQTMFIARLFILGHDACHGALFRPRFWNKILGRLFFLPSMTPYSLWELGHNSVHHGFSNLKGRDYVWTPFSPQDWRRLPRRRRLLERFYRCSLGLGVYYFVELWWKRMFFPRPSSMTSYHAGYFWDKLLNTAFLALQIAAVQLISSHLISPHLSRLAAMCFTVVLPLVLWNYLMGFTIYCHHTHPDVRWFDSRAEWSFYDAQVCSTTHTIFPGGFSWLLHNIFEHTAHHIDTGIPFYQLRAAQKKIEELCGPDVVKVEIFSPGAFLAQMRACQLYDYRKHRWMRFEETERPEQDGRQHETRVF